MFERILFQELYKNSNVVLMKFNNFDMISQLNQYYLYKQFYANVIKM